MMLIILVKSQKLQKCGGTLLENSQTESTKVYDVAMSPSTSQS